MCRAVVSLITQGSTLAIHNLIIYDLPTAAAIIVYKLITE